MEHDELDIDQQGQMPIAAYHPNVGMMELTADANISKENMGMIELNAAANTNKENSKQIWDPTTAVLHQNAILEPQQSESSKDTVASQEQMESQTDAVGKGSEDQALQMESIPDHQIMVYGLMGPYLMDKDKWPKLTLPTNTNENKDGEQLENLSQVI